MIENSNYNKKLRPYAVQNRNDATKAEACLWKFVLKGKQLGYQFNRQRPVLNYIADFMCQPLKLIIEIDGYTHLDEDVKKNDVVRQKTLEGYGFTVIRFTDGDVLKNLQFVKDEIMRMIYELEKRGLGANQ